MWSLQVNIILCYDEMKQEQKKRFKKLEIVLSSRVSGYIRGSYFQLCVSITFSNPFPHNFHFVVMQINVNFFD